MVVRMNKLSTAERARILACLVEGNSIRATVRMTGAGENTIARLLADIGEACVAFANATQRNIASKQIQCDEIWAFCYARAKNVPEEKRGEFGYGDVWTWTAVDADTKLIVSWCIGARNGATAEHFMHDVASRVSGRPQITTGGFGAYPWAVASAFNGEVDHAVVQKVYGSTLAGSGRYSPPVCVGMTKESSCGAPDMEKASTSDVERQNLTMRMGMRRFTRLTNGFSKKLANHEHAVALHFVHYNFCRAHQTLGGGKTPAMAAGLADHRWTIAELVGLLENKPGRKAA
jgi:IS1 family transposase